MTNILIRCDASLLIGSGHVMRCRALARELEINGAQITFMCRRQPGDMISILEEEFSVLILPPQPLSTYTGLKGRDLYAAWLGCSQDKDADQCLETLKMANIGALSWVIVDHYGLDARWEERLSSGMADHKILPKLLAIDDLADRPHKCDILLDQNFFGTNTHKRYEGLIPNNCEKLLGPHYALLSQEYRTLHKLIPSRTAIKRVLVYFGGVDTLDLTRLSLEVLSNWEFEDLDVDVVVGQLDQSQQEIDNLGAMRPNTTIHHGLPSLAGLIARADLSIGAGGSTTWERSCLRLPSVVIPTSENQREFCEALHEAGYIHQVETGTSVQHNELKTILMGIIQSYNDSTYRLPECLSDGLGTKRISKKMNISEGRRGQKHVELEQNTRSSYGFQ